MSRCKKVKEKRPSPFLFLLILSPNYINMKFSLLCLVTAILAFGCKQKTVDVSKDAEEIMNVDREFSEMSRQQGMKKAFLYYADSSVVLLRPDYFPIKGNDAIDFLQNINDSSFTLTWEPDNAMMALSGDMGYTYGLYTYQTADTTIQGTYVSIWQKQADGSWKYTLDSGNPGVGKNK